MSKPRPRKKYTLSAAVYDKRGRLLSRGENSYCKTHPLQGQLAIKANKPDAIYLHAEIQALVRLKDWTKAHKIVVQRFDVHGNPVNAKPCKICQMAIEHAGIKYIEHT